MQPEALSMQLALPVFKDTLINLSLFYVPFVMIVIVGAAGTSFSGLLADLVGAEGLDGVVVAAEPSGDRAAS